MTERAKVAFKVVELKDVDLNEAGEHKEKKKKNETEKAPPPKPLTFEMVFGVEWIRVRKRMVSAHMSNCGVIWCHCRSFSQFVVVLLCHIFWRKFVFFSHSNPLTLSLLSY
jgi:hypothetical protein